MVADRFARRPRRQPRPAGLSPCRVRAQRADRRPEWLFPQQACRTVDWALIDRVAAASSGCSASVTNAPHSPAGLPGSAAASPSLRLLPIPARRQRSTTEWMNALSTRRLGSTRTLSSDSPRDHVRGQLAEAQAHRQGHALAEGEHLAHAERGQERQHACGRVRNGSIEASCCAALSGESLGNRD
jgi:hypothetical protein